MYMVMEGNRRIAALKLSTALDLLDSLGLPKNLVNRFKRLHQMSGNLLPREINCTLSTPEDAAHWIMLKHTGENNGVGVVSWDGRSIQRFRGSTPALQAIEVVEKTNYISEDTRNLLPKIAITNVDRLLNTPDARQKLGIKIENGKLILPPNDNDEALQRLALVITDIAHRHVKVTDLDNKDQRVEYAKEVAARPLPGIISGESFPPTNKVGASAMLTTKPTRTVSPSRKTLIPKSCKINIQHTRINQIYHELRKLSVEDFTNSCAVMLRVFLELSLDQFAAQNVISFANPKNKGQEITLKNKVKLVADHLETTGILTQKELKPIRIHIDNPNHIFSIDTLHAYVHHKNFNPSPSDLRTHWDTIQILLEKLWS